MESDEILAVKSHCLESYEILAVESHCLESYEILAVESHCLESYSFRYQQWRAIVWRVIALDTGSEEPLFGE